jgi:dienelactone hydrolase
MQLPMHSHTWFMDRPENPACITHPERRARPMKKERKWPLLWRGCVLAGLASVAGFGLAACGTLPAHDRAAFEDTTVFDPVRSRTLPVRVYRPSALAPCVLQRTCRVALLLPGYGLAHTEYGFLARSLARRGFLVAALQPVLPGDPPPVPDARDLVAARTPMWRRGAEDLRIARAALAARHPGHDWTRLVLVGHSNGGDIASFALAQAPALASTLITLDHRRYPLPRTRGLAVLSIRGSDFAADPGVLPDETEARALGHCMPKIAGARHDDMHDAGPAALQATIVRIVDDFLATRRCAA